MAGKRPTQCVDRSPAKALRLTAPPIENDIFQLNQYCLAEIFSFLPIEDVFQVYQCDPRFREAARLRFAASGVEHIDSNFMNSWPKDLVNDFLDEFGKTFSKAMICRRIPEKEFLCLIGHFRNLKYLTLKEITVESSTAASLPTNLVSLDLERCLLSEALLKDWMPKLSPTLVSISIEMERFFQFNLDLSALLSLRNIRTFIAGSMMMDYPEVFRGIIDNNKDHLTTLTTAKDIFRPISITVWKVIIQLQCLEHLQLCQPSFLGGIPAGQRLFPNLVSLRLNFCSESLRLVIDRLDCVKTLEWLVIDQHDLKNLPISASSLKRFSNLRHLEILVGDWTEPLHLMQLAELTGLTELVLDWGAFDRADDVLELLRRMPFLCKIQMQSIVFMEPWDHQHSFESEFVNTCNLAQPPIEYVLSVESDNYLCSSPQVSSDPEDESE